MADRNDVNKRYLAILEVLNRMIEKNIWQETLFLKGIHKKLIDIRDRFIKEANLEEYESNGLNPTATIADRVAMRTGRVEVFVMLYNADGQNISKWEHILNSISTHIVSRPTYHQEKDAKAALRAATYPYNEAYAAVYIHETDVLKLKPEQIPRDRYGNELLVVRDHAIKKENIMRFVHKTGNYVLKNDKLIWKSAADFL